MLDPAWHLNQGEQGAPIRCPANSKPGSQDSVGHDPTLLSSQDPAEGGGKMQVLPPQPQPLAFLAVVGG